jgi:hypothetical protein
VARKPLGVQEKATGVSEPDQPLVNPSESDSVVVLVDPYQQFGLVARDRVEGAVR